MRPLLFATLAVLGAFSPVCATAQGEADVRLGPQEWRRMNVFFSNFAEAGVQPFHRGEVPPATLIQFGVLHNIINRGDRIQPVPGHPNDGRLRTSDVEASVEKYFGLHLSNHQSLQGDYSWIEYHDGYYVFPRADGETLPFAQITRLLDAGGGEFVAFFSIYSMPDYDVDAYGTPVEQMRRSGYEVERASEMRARIRRVREDGQERYILLEYLPVR